MSQEEEFHLPEPGSFPVQEAETYGMRHADCSYTAVQVRDRGAQRRQRGGWGRAASCSGAAFWLCCAGMLYARTASRVSVGTTSVAAQYAASAESGTVIRGRKGERRNTLSVKQLADMKQMYAESPQLVKEFALLTGSTGQKLLSEIAGESKSETPPVFKGPHLSFTRLDKDMSKLSDLTETGLTGNNSPLSLSLSFS